MTNKPDYVRKESRKGTKGHHCHWPGCRHQVAPAMWGCNGHWLMLPKVLRTKLWRAYQPGQEISKTPSKDYITAAHEIQEWIAKNYDS